MPTRGSRRWLDLFLLQRMEGMRCQSLRLRLIGRSSRSTHPPTIV